MHARSRRTLHVHFRKVDAVARARIARIPYELRAVILRRHRKWPCTWPFVKENGHLETKMAIEMAILSRPRFWRKLECHFASSATMAAPAQLALADIAKHNSFADCWLIINSRVWDVTNFMRDHPGGAAIIRMFGGVPAIRFVVSRGSWSDSVSFVFASLQAKTAHAPFSTSIRRRTCCRFYPARLSASSPARARKRLPNWPLRRSAPPHDRQSTSARCC